jgi:hypothetical protein
MDFAQYAKCFRMLIWNLIELSSMSEPGNWSWNNVRDQIRTLAGKLGFPEGEHLDFLKIRVNLNDGKLLDLLKSRELDASDHHQGFMIKTAYYILVGYVEAQSVELTGRLIAYRNLRGARFGDFSNIGAREKLLTLYAGGDTRLREAARLLGGLEVEFPYGDYAFKINTLPLIPLTFVLSSADAEFPVDARIFYDENIESYLDVERINFLTNLTIARLEEVIATS